MEKMVTPPVDFRGAVTDVDGKPVRDTVFLELQADGVEVADLRAKCERGEICFRTQDGSFPVVPADRLAAERAALLALIEEAGDGAGADAAARLAWLKEQVKLRG